MTRALLIALLLGLFAAACGDAEEADPVDTVEPQPDVTEADGDEPTPEPDAGEPEPEPDGDEPEPEPDADEPGVSWPNVVINEVAANGAPADWIELLNRSDETVDLSGWTLTDDDPEHVHAFEDGHTLGAGAYLLLLRDDAGGFSFGLGGGDAVHLYAPDGTHVDGTEWVGGQSPTDHTWGRIPNGFGDFMTLETPTPGGANASNAPQECGNGTIELGEVCDGAALDDESCESFLFAGGVLGCSAACDGFDTSMCVPPSRVVVINEVTSSEDDRIELFNPGFSPVVLAGWMLTDENDDPSAGVYTFPGGVVLGAGEYRVLTKDVDHLFGLGGKDKVKLWDAEGVLVDILAWGKDEAEISYCLIPNGGDTAQPCDPQTFGESND